MGIVCLCHRVTQSEIEDSIRNGNNTVSKLMKDTGAGTCCASCLDELYELVGETDEEDQEDTIHSAEE